jgi:hypothetical protein
LIHTDIDPVDKPERRYDLGDVEAAVAAVLTAKGSGALPFEQMMELIEVGRSRGLAVSTVDVTYDNG